MLSWPGWWDIALRDETRWPTVCQGIGPLSGLFLLPSRSGVLQQETLNQAAYQNPTGLQRRFLGPCLEIVIEELSYQKLTDDSNAQTCWI